MHEPSGMERTMQVGLTEAAKLTGKDASTITRRAKSGKLSYTVDDHGTRLFEVAELERVFGTLKTPEPEPPTSTHDARTDALHDREVQLLRDQIRLLEAQAADLRAERDRWQEQAGQITRLLTDQTEKQQEEEVSAMYERVAEFTKPRRGLIARLFGRR